MGPASMAHPVLYSHAAVMLKGTSKHSLFIPAGCEPLYTFVAFGGHIFSNMAFSCALSAAFSHGLITKLNI